MLYSNTTFSEGQHKGLLPIGGFQLSLAKFPAASVLFSSTISSIVGSVVECSPATRAARVRFPDDANIFVFFCLLLSKSTNWTNSFTFLKQNRGKLMKRKEKKLLETRGIDPRTSHMLSERSTIWATSPPVIKVSWEDRVYHHNTVGISISRPLLANQN